MNALASNGAFGCDKTQFTQLEPCDNVSRGPPLGAVQSSATLLWLSVIFSLIRPIGICREQ